ncbi:MAG: flagellar basal body-associated FliL family protein [Burkholderiaceae bacterium]|jgi:flagellar FliL protein|nr:flagellar basal body-associated FliL family protein [Burkholderiaceae bacterium]HMN63443.1 flagellar basal body-associated FliL family protein [Burkholderiaceae bacterium]
MPDQAATQDTPPKKRSRRPLVVVAAVALLAAGGGGAWWMTRPAADGHAAAESSPRASSVFVPLDQFTVNLADDGGERFAQLAMTLEVVDSHAEAALKARMPAIRNAILLLLSASSSKDLLTVAGKQKLADQVAAIAGHELGWQAEAAGAAEPAVQPRKVSLSQARPNPVLAVNFSHFIIQ